MRSNHFQNLVLGERKEKTNDSKQSYAVRKVVQKCEERFFTINFYAVRIAKKFAFQKVLAVTMLGISVSTPSSRLQLAATCKLEPLF